MGPGQHTNWLVGSALHESNGEETHLDVYVAGDKSTIDAHTSWCGTRVTNFSDGKCLGVFLNSTPRKMKINNHRETIKTTEPACL